ncbi:MAG: S8 family serine peptidase [Symplocastrum torsivum CPER-KK1]|jgi:subtilisin family serine protease|uniref:S8 family serine peptidase n=1 Tax=Symplocastrum torsivum CPER-KK1 TaxID=450513 RepID=A0A951UB27_9CYAN|nr:S8 family serine peptidase [Symplocastrum torsivum CPER-KK1]
MLGQSQQFLRSSNPVETDAGFAIPATPISNNQTLYGTLTTTDPNNPNRDGSYSDGYLLTGADGGEVVQVSLDSSAFDTYLQVVNADTGDIITFNDDFDGLNAQVSFTVEEGIDYVIQATSYGAGATGEYTLTTSSTDDSLWVPISDNQTLNGTLSVTDPNNPNRDGSYSDGYLLTGADVGEVVQVSLDSSAFDTYLQVVNADTGDIITFNDDFDGLNAQVSFTVEEGIDYIIQATSYGAGATGNYTITTSSFTLPDGYNINYGYGLVDAAAAVASALGENNPFPNVPNLGGDNWGLDMINAPEVWEEGFTGEGIVVAVIDSGVDYNHSDLDDNIWVNSGEIAGNGLDDDNNGYVDDFQGWDFVDGDNDPMDLDSHGTHVAGTIAAENNGFGVTGVAYDALIMPVRVLDADGFGSWSDIANGITYAADNGADVINLSLGGGTSIVDEVAVAIEYAAGLGSVVVMASGNEYAGQPGFPGNFANEWGIAVGAVNSTKTLADFSNDAGSIPLDYVVAPGVNILSTTPGDTYEYFSGTSMATPHVAGVAALIFSANPNLTANEVESILTATADSTGIIV